MAGTGETEKAAALIVKFKSDDVDGFVAKHGHDIDARGVFLKSAKPPRLGLAVDLELQLRDGTRLVKGRGRIVWRRLSSAGPELPSGIGVAFDTLDATSTSFVEHIVELRGSAPSRFDDPAGAEIWRAPTQTAGDTATEPDPAPAAQATPRPASEQAAPKAIPSLGEPRTSTARRIPALAPKPIFVA